MVPSLSAALKQPVRAAPAANSMEKVEGRLNKRWSKELNPRIVTKVILQHTMSERGSEAKKFMQQQTERPTITHQLTCTCTRSSGGMHLPMPFLAASSSACNSPRQCCVLHSLLKNFQFISPAPLRYDDRSGPWAPVLLLFCSVCQQTLLLKTIWARLPWGTNCRRHTPRTSLSLSLSLVLAWLFSCLLCDVVCYICPSRWLHLSKRKRPRSSCKPLSSGMHSLSFDSLLSIC